MLKHHAFVHIVRQTILVAVGLLICASAASTSIGQIRFFQTDFYPGTAHRIPLSEWGDLAVNVGPDPSPLPGYLQLGIANTPSSPIQWAVRNMAVPAGADLQSTLTLNRFFDLRLIGITNGTAATSLYYVLQITPATLDFFEPLTPPVFAPIGLRPYKVGAGSGEGGGDDPTTPGAPPAYGGAVAAGMSATTATLRSNMPDVEEGINECGLGAITRSLRWLHNRGDIEANVTDAQLMEDLRTSSNWNASGIPTYVDTLNAKLAAGKRFGLNVKFMVRRPSSVPDGDYTTPEGTADSQGDNPTFDFIKKEMVANEDVEILVGWINGDGSRTSGHYMTVVGFADSNSSGVREIVVQDDEDQGTTNAKNSRRSTRYTDPGGGAPPRLDDLPDNRVEMVISESPRPKVTEGAATAPNRVRVGYGSIMSETALEPGSYLVSGPGIGTLGAHPDAVLPLGNRRYELRWNSGLMAGGQNVTVTVSDAVEDQDGNPVGSDNQVTFAGFGAPCAFSAAPPAQSFTAGGGAGSFTLATSSGCPWQASSNAAWITIANPSGLGNTLISYFIPVNPSTSARIGTIMVAGQTHTVTQAGRVLGGSTYSPLQKLFVRSDGTGWQELVYNYNTTEIAVTPYQGVDGTIIYPVAYGEWVGVYHYDYATARFSEAIYETKVPL